MAILRILSIQNIYFGFCKKPSGPAALGFFLGRKFSLHVCRATFGFSLERALAAKNGGMPYIHIHAYMYICAYILYVHVHEHKTASFTDQLSSTRHDAQDNMAILSCIGTRHLLRLLCLHMRKHHIPDGFSKARWCADERQAPVVSTHRISASGDIAPH
jgi:hypothetical protein